MDEIKDILKVVSVICIIAFAIYAKHVKEENEKMINNIINKNKTVVPIVKPVSTDSEPDDEIEIGSNNDIYFGNSDEYQYNSTIESEYTREPIRQQCRVCEGSGNCRVCGGTGQTNSKLGYSYSEGIQALSENCKSCGGSGRCTACGGDGWLDEGSDF